MRIPKVLLTVALLMVCSFSAHAIPVDWFVIAEFDDALLLGSFTYDADTNIFNSIDVSTTTGAIPGAHYTSLASGYTPVPYAVAFEAGDSTLLLWFTSDLSNAGGLVDLNPAFSGEAHLRVSRQVVVGFAAGTPTPIPEPSTALLPLPAIAAFILSRKRANRLRRSDTRSR